MLCLFAPVAGLLAAPRAAPISAGPPARRAPAPLALFDALFGKAKQPAEPQDAADAAQASRLGVQLPSYEVLASGDDWEVRSYQTLSVIECTYEKRPEGYELLGGYVGGEAFIDSRSAHAICSSSDKTSDGAQPAAYPPL